MKIVTLSRISFIIFTVAVFNSCGNNKNGGDTETVGITENVKYILLPDADSILPEWSKENVVVNHWVGDPDNLHPTNGGTEKTLPGTMANK